MRRVMGSGELFFNHKLNKEIQLITLFGQHGVKDFEAWLSGGKQMMSDSNLMAQLGIVGTSIYRTVDKSEVLVAHKFNNLDDAIKYKNNLESADFHSILKQIGGIPPARLWIMEEV